MVAGGAGRGKAQRPRGRRLWAIAAVWYRLQDCKGDRPGIDVGYHAQAMRREATGDGGAARPSAAGGHAAREVRVRFAPSPTGYLHLGGARTALYNYIYARRNNGTFVLRIEDTDPSRSTNEAIAQILRSMREMELDWDEGPEKPGPHAPYRQTERVGIYREYAEKLLAGGHLYPCFCTPEELEAERQQAQVAKRAWLYSGKCRNLSTEEVERRKVAGEPWTLRFKVPPGRTVFADMLRDPVEFDNATIGDFIVQRSDGTYTYNFAVVVDDVTMEITHVIRGDDHLSNTPKQILIYEALGAPVPRFLHMPLLFGTDRKKLSKRHGATKLEQLTLMGYLVEVVRNYLCFLSTEFDESMIAWSLADLVRNFDVEKLGTSPSIFDVDKLRWMNGRFIRQLDPAELGERLVAYLTRVGFYRDPAAALPGVATGAPPEATPEPCEPTPRQAELTRAVAPLVQEKIELLADFSELAGWFFRPLELGEDAFERLGSIDGAKVTLARAAAELARLEPFDAASVEAYVRGLPARVGEKPKAVFAALRLGMSGQPVTPGLFESLAALGRDEAAARLAQAAALLS
jgi:glutamyl-tRNA synthetase